MGDFGRRFKLNGRSQDTNSGSRWLFGDGRDG